MDSRSKQRRLFVTTIDARLFAIHAATGKACDNFGVGGLVDLRRGLRSPPHYGSEYEETSPPAVIGDLVVVGSAVADNNYVDAASGEVRAFDARTGKLAWTWDPMPGQRGRGQHRVHHLDRFRAEADLSADWKRQPGLLRRRASRKRPVCQ